MKFDQDLRLNLRYDIGKMNSTLGSVVPLAMFYSSLSPGLFCKASPSLCDQNLTRPKEYAVTEIFTQAKNFAMNNDHFPNRNP